MSNNNLNVLLKEYDHKRTLAQIDLQKRKDNLFILIPRLTEIENEINSIAIATTKSILQNNSKNSLTDLNKKINTLKKEKKEILKKNGYDISYLKPFYECSLCEDTGFVSDEYNNKKMCNCLKQKLLNLSFDQSNLSNLEKENFSNFDESIFSTETDLAKYGQNISPRKNILNIKQHAEIFIENFDDPKTKNLLFTGGTGLRKNFFN